MAILMQDVKFAVRMLRKSPGFTIVAILTLALGIGANTAIFSIVKAVILQPLPGVRHSDEFVSLGTRQPTGDVFPLSYPLYRALRDKNSVLESVAADCPITFPVKFGSETKRVAGEVVTGNYFDALGVHAALGRTLTPDDDKVPNGSPFVVLSNNLWKKEFGSDPSVIGRSVIISGKLFTIIGVMPESFQGANVGIASDVFVPAMMQPLVLPVAVAGGNILEVDGANWLFGFGRMKPGITPEKASAALTVTLQGFAKEHGEASPRETAAVTPVWKTPFGAAPAILPIVAMLSATVAFVLLIACANVAGLLIARSTARRTEVAIRVALGAGRGRLIRQLLSESILMSLLGGAVGLLLALWTTKFMAHPPQLLGGVPLSLDARLDAEVFAFTLVVATLAGILFGLAPSLLASRVDLVPALKGEEGGRRSRKSPLRSGLVAVQVAVSLVLLVGSGLMLRSVLAARSTELGFKPNDILSLSVDTSPAGYDEARVETFIQQLIDQVKTVPGVQSAAVAQAGPVAQAHSYSTTLTVEGYEPLRDQSMNTGFDMISPGLFDTLGLPLRAGRDFSWTDDAKTTRVAIVNETLAKRYWPGKSALGKRIKGETDKWDEVVGVVADTKYQAMSEKPTPYFYVPFRQTAGSDIALFVRTATAPESLGSAIQSAVIKMDPALAVSNLRTMRQTIDLSLVGSEATALLLSVIGFIGLLLATIGIYGVVAYSVAQRTHEVGIRMALGADARNILGLILRQGMLPALIGVAIGLAGSFALTRFIEGQLYGVKPTDPLTLAAVSALLCAVTAIACVIPARRAMKVDPMVALRYE
jgi:macrolide transport system ATP-binding/permease protein